MRGENHTLCDPPRPVQLFVVSSLDGVFYWLDKPYYLPVFFCFASVSPSKGQLWLYLLNNTPPTHTDSECSDTPEIPNPSHRCLNSVARSPARTVQRYGNSGPAAGRRFKSASISALNRNSVGLRFVPRDFNFLRVKQIVRLSQLMSSASRQAPSDCAAPVCHSSS